MTLDELIAEVRANAPVDWLQLPDGVMYSARYSREAAGLFLGLEAEVGLLFDNKGFVGFYGTLGPTVGVGTIGLSSTVSHGLVFGSIDDFRGPSVEFEVDGLVSASFGRPLQLFPSDGIDTRSLASSILAADWNDTEAIRSFSEHAPRGFSVHFGGTIGVGASGEFGYTFAIRKESLGSIGGSIPVWFPSLYQSHLSPSAQEDFYAPLSDSLSGVTGLVPDALGGTAFEHFLPSTLLSNNGGLGIDWDWSTVSFNEASLAVPVQGGSFDYITVPGISVVDATGNVVPDTVLRRGEPWVPQT